MDSGLYRQANQTGNQMGYFKTNTTISISAFTIPYNHKLHDKTKSETMRPF
jgi:hypothetical protein